MASSKPQSSAPVSEFNSLERINRVNSIITQEMMTADISSKFEALSIQFQKPKELNELSDVASKEKIKTQDKKKFDSPLPVTPKKSSYYNLVLTPKRYFFFYRFNAHSNINLA